MLAHSPCANGHEPAPRTTRNVLLWIGVLASILALLIWTGYAAYRALTDIEQGQHWNRVDWLPAEATDVSFYRSYLITVYEFNISEEGFRNWAEQWDIAEITRPMKIARHGLVTDQSPQPETPFEYVEWEAIRYATISRGLYFGYEASNGGGVWVAYDRDAGRAYFRSTPR